MKNKVLLLVAVVGVVLFVGQCSLTDFLPQEAEIPTKTRMQGVWQVTEAYNDSGASIKSKIQFPTVVFDLGNTNSVVSTAGPMFMYIVYGGSKYTEIASKIDQVFNYNEVSSTAGEWGVGSGVVSRFALEMKLAGLPGQESITSLLTMLGIDPNNLPIYENVATVYHKFKYVKVSLDQSDTLMTWEFDDSTEAVYNIKDANLDYVLWTPWNGWTNKTFQRCRIVLTKRMSTMADLVKAAIVP